MTTPSLLILTPSLGRVSLGYRDTFAAVVLECARRDIRLAVSDATDPGQLVHARNVLYAAAFESDATHVLWWDTDVSFPPSCLFALLHRPEDMIARPYPMRAVDWAAVADFLRERMGDRTVPLAEELKRAGQCWTAQIDYDSGKPVWSADRNLVRITSCGFGWVLMQTDAMRRFWDDWARMARDLPKDWRMRPHVELFDLVSPIGITHGEDTSFCWQWRTSGRRIWAAVDARIRNGDHAGTFRDYLEAHGLLP